VARHPDSPDIRRIERAAGRVPTLAEAFAADPGRAARFSFAHGNMWADFSMQHLTDELLSALVDLARTAGVEEKRDAMLRGDAVNVTEGRKVLHTALRSGDSTDEARLAAAQTGRAAALAERLRADPGVRAVVNIGIGGSDLGPVMAHRALRAHRDGPECRFVSNIDPADLDDALHGLDPATTVFVVASKTFTTQETMHNAERAREWVRSALGDAWAARFVATTAEPARAQQWGVPADQCLEFWDWVGGRFSLASVIGFPVMMAVGPARFAELLAGMRSMDTHFAAAPLASNIPVLHALVAWVNTTVFSRPTCAVVPYSHDLARLPAYLQQLVMESNGKSVDTDGHEVMHQTSPVIWGDAGTNGQHAFFQLLHQGTRVVPVDFIGVREPTGSDRAAHDMLVANMIAQAAALALGRPHAEEPHRVFPGNRPSTTILLDDLSPHSLGEIIAMYEHSTAVQGWLFGINSFDQFGVELGKELATALLPEVQGGRPGPGTSATRAAVDRYRSR
jgi:glucose-6-phosphate isomerase